MGAAGAGRSTAWKERIGELPLVAIGGMTLERAPALAAGADSVAVVTDILLTPTRRRARASGERPWTRHDRPLCPPDGPAGGRRRRPGPACRRHVLVVGAGGLGSPVLATLAGAGVGRLTILDHDRVEESNLHRQPLYRMADLGRLKADCRPRGLSPPIPTIAVDGPRRLAVAERPRPRRRATTSSSTVPTAWLSPTSSATPAAMRASPWSPPPSSASRAMSAPFCGGAPSYRAVFPDMPSVVGSCATNGVLGSAVAVLGALQAHMALQLLLGLAPSPLGRLVSVDLRTLAFGGFAFHEAAEPQEPAIPFVARVRLPSSDLVIDLRGPAEAPEPVTPDALRLSRRRAWATCQADRRIVLCCASGIRAHRAARLLAERGAQDLAVLALSLGYPCYGSTATSTAALTTQILPPSSSPLGTSMPPGPTST